MKAPAHEAAEQQQAKADLGSLDAAPKHAVPPGYIHLGVAKGIYAVLNELGADPDEVISEAGVDPRIFGDPATQIPVSALGRLVLLASPEPIARISGFSSAPRRPWNRLDWSGA